MLTIGHILTALANYQAANNEPLVASVVIDSRLAEQGSVFAAFTGENVDGHDYVSVAFENGAIAAIVEKSVGDYALVDCRGDSAVSWDGATPVQILVEDTEAALQQMARFWRQQFDVRVIGVVGSVGKTTTKELTHSVLSQRYSTLKSEKNYNTQIGLPLQLLKLKPEHERVVLEMGMYVPGDIALLASVAQPNIGVLTLIGSVHIERAGSQEAIVRGKREIVEALPADGIAILNKDEPLVMGMAPYTQAKIFTYGIDNSADLYATDIESLGLSGMQFTLNYQGEAVPVQIPLLGHHSVHTALRATAVGLVEGLAWDEIVRGLQDRREQLRLIAVDGPLESVILDDTYNASPRSTIAALNLLAELDGRKVAVLGNMLELGTDEQSGHERVGLRAYEVADVLVVVGELGRIIGETALSAGMDANHIHFAATPADAVGLLKALIEPKDMIIVKGSLGARLDQIVTALTETADDIRPNG